MHAAFAIVLACLMPTITKTIGAAGDYTTWGAAVTAWNAGTIAGASAADDIVLQEIDGAAYDESMAFSGNPGTYNSLTVNASSGARHDGTPGSGARIAKSGNVSGAVISFTSPGCNCTVEWLEAYGTGGNINDFITFPTADTARTHTVRNCILHDNGAPTTGDVRPIAFGNVNVVAHNNLIFNISDAATGAADVTGIGFDSATTPSVDIHNNTIYNLTNNGGTGAAIGIHSSTTNPAADTIGQANKQVRNNVVIGVGGTSSGTKACFGFTCTGAAVCTHNASSDTSASTASSDSGATALTSQASSVWEDAASDLFAPASGSALFEAAVDLGTTPTGVNIDITGRNRDSEADTWSIGAYQLEAGGAVSAVDITVPEAFRTYQRDISDQADIVVSGTYASETVTSIEYRLNGGSWLTLDNTLAGGTFSGTIADVPAGVNVIDVRLNDETAVTDSVANVLVGDVILVIGQSNAAGRLTNDQSYTHASLKAAMYDGSWAELTDSFAASSTTGSPWPLLATQWLADQSVPLAIMNKASSGTPIASWWDGTAQSLWTTAKTTVTSSGVNGLAAVLIDVGENDATNDIETAAWNEDLDGLAADVQSTYGCPLIVACTGTQPGVDADSDLDKIRLAQTTSWEDNANCAAGPMAYDRANLHWETDGEGLIIAGRWWLACEAALFGGPNGRGPRFSNATEHQDRDQIDITVDQTLTTDASIDVDSFIVTDDGTPATITAASVNGTTITLTLSAPLSGSATLVTFATGNDAAGNDVPDMTITLPDATTVSLPLEPFIAEDVVEASSGGGSIFSSGIIMALLIGLPLLVWQYMRTRNGLG